VSGLGGGSAREEPDPVHPLGSTAQVRTGWALGLRTERWPTWPIDAVD
jgi:hypothetical protein